MTEHALHRHANGPAAGVGLELLAAVERHGELGVRLSYRLRGDLAKVALAAAAPARRAERLWEHTCFEAFVAPAAGERYFEINLAPSSEWAAYAFDGYRAGMRPLELARPPEVAVVRQATELRVTADLDFGALGPAPWPWRVGLAAVVADADAAGRRSYWALRHPGAKPDFHDAAGFTLRLEGNAR